MMITVMLMTLTYNDDNSDVDDSDNRDDSGVDDTDNAVDDTD